MYISKQKYHPNEKQKKKKTSKIFSSWPTNWKVYSNLQVCSFAPRD